MGRETHRRVGFKANPFSFFNVLNRVLVFQLRDFGSRESRAGEVVSDLDSPGLGVPVLDEARVAAQDVDEVLGESVLALAADSDWADSFGNVAKKY